MTLSKSVRYALYATMEMALVGDRLVTAADVAARYAVPRTALAKVLQHLVRAGIASGTRGIGGGYRLARPGSQLTVLDLITVFEPPRAGKACRAAAPEDDDCGRPADCALRRLLDEVDEQARCTYASVTIDTLVGAAKL